MSYEMPDLVEAVMRYLEFALSSVIMMLNRESSVKQQSFLFLEIV